MSFPTPRTDDPVLVSSGERYGHTNISLAATTFEDGLRIGRFAKLDAGSIDNVDGSASPVIAGVPLRSAARAVEDVDVIDQTLYGQIEYMRQGLVTVDVVTGDTPAQFGAVFVSNAGNADDGKATTLDDATTVASTAEFIREIQTDVWLVRIK